VKKRSGWFGRVEVESGDVSVVSHGGGMLLVETARAVRLDRALGKALADWRKPLAVHHPGKVALDVALSLALGGDCLADVAVLRGQGEVFGQVASDATVSRTVSVLAEDAARALPAIRKARAEARARAWALAGDDAPGARGGEVIVDLDATLVTAHSEKEQAAPTFKRGFGHHPLCAFVDHGQAGTGEPLAIVLRAGNAGSNTAADHILVVRQALAQLPPSVRRGKRLVIRTDGAGGTREFVAWLSKRRLGYSVGFPLSEKHVERIRAIPAEAWTPAYDTDDPEPGDAGLREGAWVVDATGVLDLAGWPADMRVIVRKERPHPGAQLTFTDVDGLRLTAFATNTRTPGRQVPPLELRHRRRARAEDRIRIAKDTGLRNLPLHGFAQNEVWCELVQLALELTAWTQLLAFAKHPARRWEPKRLRLRLFSTAARLVRTGRRTILQLPKRHAWTETILSGLTTLAALAAPG
jgi:Transposase DDE domain group 1